MDKRFLVEQLVKKIHALAEQAMRTAEEARIEAKTGANRAVNLSRGVSMRSEAVLKELDALEFFKPKPLARGERIGLGAVVEIENEEGGKTLFLAPVGAGTELTARGGDGIFQVVTPASPVGHAIVGKKVGDVIEVMARGELSEWTIAYAA